MKMTKKVPTLKEPTVQPIPDIQVLHRNSRFTEAEGTSQSLL